MALTARMGPADGWDQARKLLCVRLDTLGDVLMTTPAFRALRESLPGRTLTLLTSSAGAGVAPLLPEVDDLVVYDPPWMKATAVDPDARSDRAMIERLADERFDGAVVFTVYSQSSLPAALLCYLAGIPRRLAFARENPYHLLTDWQPEREPQELVRHEVRRHLDLVAAIGSSTTDERLSLRPSEEAVAGMRQRLDELGLGPERRWAVIHPGATAASRRYPAEGFIEAATVLVGDHGWDLVFTGSPEERTLVEHIRAGIGLPTHSLAGELSIDGLGALLSCAPLLISNNTGPVHVAAAVGTPVVVLYALTNPQHTPWEVPSRVLYHDVPCRFCYRSVCPEGHHNCLRLVSPKAVVGAAQELLEETSGGRDLSRRWPSEPVVPGPLPAPVPLLRRG